MGKVLLVLYDGGIHAEQEPQLLGTTENELGIRKWIEEQGHELVTTSNKEGENSEFDKHLVDAEVIITTPYVRTTPQCPPGRPHLHASSFTSACTSNANTMMRSNIRLIARGSTVSTPVTLPLSAWPRLRT
jgi:hypothetical protein